MSDDLRAYRELRRQMHELRATDHTEQDEDALLDRMDVVWERLLPTERDELDNEEVLP